MIIPDFSISKLPCIVFGDGAHRRLPELALQFGSNILLVTGAESLRNSPAWPDLQRGFQEQDLSCRHSIVSSEPSPRLVDEVSREFRAASIDVVIGIGGGSVMDAAKAIAGLLSIDHSVMDYLEGIGPELPYRGPSIPFIAVPTTAGTGSEATRNAVLSVQGPNGFKKSFRHEQLVPRYAVVDPEMLASCSRDLIAADGLDALTQLLESYVSLKANPLTDSLVKSGIAATWNALLPWYFEAGDVTVHRRSMAYAALLSGIALAQTGLGSVHGLASPLGAFFSIPHGVVCGSLLAACTHANLQALGRRNPGGPVISKYAELGRLFAAEPDLADDDACNALTETLYDWTTKLQMPRLSEFGMSAADIPRVVANSRGSSMKTNPIVLTDGELSAVLKERL